MNGVIWPTFKPRDIVKSEIRGFNFKICNNEELEYAIDYFFYDNADCKNINLFENDIWYFDEFIVLDFLFNYCNFGEELEGDCSWRLQINYEIFKFIYDKYYSVDVQSAFLNKMPPQWIYSLFFDDYVNEVFDKDEVYCKNKRLSNQANKFISAGYIDDTVLPVLNNYVDDFVASLGRINEALSKTNRRA